MSTEISGVALVNATADNTIIGATTPVAGTFTNVTNVNETSTGTITAVNVNATGIVNLTGSVEVPTVGSGDNSTSAVSTAWSKFGLVASLIAFGYLKFPTWMGGLIIQWGNANGASSTINIPFNTSFATACWCVQAIPVNYGPNAGRANPYLNSPPGLSSFDLTSSGSTNSVFWFAIGK